MSISFKMQNFAESIAYYDRAIMALEKENKKSKKIDSIKLKNSEDIEKMKESREKARELLPATKRPEKQVLLASKEEKEQTTKTAEEEKEKVSISSQKEIISIHSFEFPDLALDVSKFARLEEAAIQISLGTITKNHQFEIIRLNDEGDCHIIHAGTGLALTVNLDEGNRIKLSPLESKVSNQTWKIEAQQGGASKIISNVNQKKLCAIYENDKKIKFYTQQMKLKEAGKLTLQDCKDSIKVGIDLWLLNTIL